MSTEPAWVAVLRAAAAGSSQARIGQRIGYSAAVVNQVLKGTYNGDLTAVEKAVRGALMNETVECPVAGVGEIRKDQCLRFQRQPLRATNRANVALYRACPACPNNLRGGAP